MCAIDLRVGARPVRDQLGPQQQRAGQLERIVEALLLGAVVLRALPSSQGLQDSADRGGALRREVAADHRGAAERDAKPEAAVFEAVVRVVRVGLLLAPPLDRVARDHREVVQWRPGRGRVEQDPVGLVPHPAGSFRVQAAILSAHDWLICPAQGGAQPRPLAWRRISRTAALASFLVSPPLAASQAEDDP